MSVTAKALREDRAKIATVIYQMRDLLTGDKTAFTAEEETKWKSVNDDYNALTKRIEIVERADQVQKDQTSRIGDLRIGRDPIKPRGGDGAEAVTDLHRALAMQAWVRTQFDEDVTDEQEDACRLVGLNPNRRQLKIQLYGTEDLRRLQRSYRSVHPSEAVEHVSEFKANMSAVTGSGGAYLIPPESLIRSLEINMLAFGGVRQVAETMRTAAGERMSWPTADDTSNEGEQLGEGASVGSSVDPTAGKVFWDAYKFSSKLIRVVYELLEDSAFNLVATLGEMLGERLGRITNKKYTTGSGSGTAKGMVTAAGTVAAASATDITFDDIIKLEHAVDPAYRMGAGFMCHDSLIEVLRKKKDGNGRYLWEDNQQIGEPQRLHGRQMTINQNMDSTLAATKKSLLYGQLFRYKIRSVNGLRLYRLQERFRDNDEDGFIAFIREDGNLLEAGTKPVKVLLH